MVWTKKMECEKCGAEYMVSEHKHPARDKGTIVCECGHEIFEWNCAALYSWERIEADEGSD